MPHRAPKDSDHLFRFEMSNNTVYRWSKGSGYALCKTDDSFSAESEFIFCNNLVYQPGVEGQEPKLVSATGGKLSAQNNLVVDYGSYNLSGALSSVIDDHSLARSEEHTSELQSRPHLVCRLLLEKKKKEETSTD